MADGLGFSLADLDKNREIQTEYSRLQSDLKDKIDLLITLVTIQQNRIMTLQNNLDAVQAKVDVMSKPAPEIIPLTS